MSSLNVNATLPHNSSSSFRPSGTSPFSTEAIIGLIALNAIFSLVGTFGNALVLLAIIKNPCLQTVPDLFIFSLAIADLLVTAGRQPLLIYEASKRFQPRIYQLVLYKVVNTASMVSNLGSVTNMFAVTLDRFLAIRHPLLYPLIVTEKRTLLVIVGCWVLSSLLTAIHISRPNFGRQLTWAFIALSLISTVAIYCYLFLVAKQQQNRIIVPSTIGNETAPNRQTQERKAAKTIALVVGVYIIVYIPFLAYTISHMNEDPAKFVRVFYWLYSICMCNSTINPYIYCARNSRYKDAFRKLLGITKNGTNVDLPPQWAAPRHVSQQ